MISPHERRASKKDTNMYVLTLDNHHIKMSWYDPETDTYHDKHYYNLTALINDYTTNDLKCYCYAGKIFTYIKNRCQCVYIDDDNFKVHYNDASHKSVFAISYHNVTIYNMVKRLGSEEYDTKTASYIAATMDLPRYNSTYTSWLGRQVDEEYIKQTYPHRPHWISNVFINDMSRGGMLFAVLNQTYHNCYKYDFKSYYPALMMLDKPLNYHYNSKGRDLSRVQLLHIKVDKIKAKNFNFLPLCVTTNMSKNNDTVIGNRVAERAGGLVYAEHYEFWIFSFLEELIWYAYDIAGGVILRAFDVEFEHNHDGLRLMRDRISEWFDIKEHHKDDANYKGFKVALNRLSHGFLLTSHNSRKDPAVKVPRSYDLPSDLGVYNVAYGQWFIWELCKKIGMEHVIASNTDCIVVDHEIPWLETVCVLPPDKRQGKLGYLIKEEHYDRIRYLAQSTCIYETRGKLGAKLPGVPDEDKARAIEGKTFDEFTINTVVDFPVARALRERIWGIELTTGYKPITISENIIRRKLFSHNAGDDL